MFLSDFEKVSKNSEAKKDKEQKKCPHGYIIKEEGKHPFKIIDNMIHFCEECSKTMSFNYLKDS
ncbi:MAG: hypothetical protein GY909_15405 [Oligoflexia bacterium]|nr:hypothetical protein [Oligoflexia bacterium]